MIRWLKQWFAPTPSSPPTDRYDRLVKLIGDRKVLEVFNDHETDKWYVDLEDGQDHGVKIHRTMTKLDWFEVDRDMLARLGTLTHFLETNDELSIFRLHMR